MNYKETIDFIEYTENAKRQIDNSRMKELMKGLGNPQDQLRFIHVAGTNGKGSCVKTLSTILMEAGYKVGTYISPHLIKYEERISVNDKSISRKDFCCIGEQIRNVANKMKRQPTVFEKLTAMGFVYFAKKKCDVVVLEVGLGGRLDATNLILKSDLSIIMNIGLEHTEILGDTLEKIAYEKAGIIKEGTDVVSYDNKKVVIDVIKEVAKTKHAKLHVANFKDIKVKKEGLNGQCFDYGKYKNIKLSLLGKHQFYNGATILEACDVLMEKGYKISLKNIKDGFIKTVWDARLSLLSKKPLFILDGAHNPQCADALKVSLPALLKKKKAIIICGVLKDKDYKSLMKSMIPFAKEFICLTPDSKRALSANELALFLNKYKQKTTVANSVKDGIKIAFDKVHKNDVILAFGSLYLAGTIKKEFNKVYKNRF